MAAYSWVDIAKHLGISMDELRLYRNDQTSPVQPTLGRWEKFMQRKKGTPNTSALPGENIYDAAVKADITNYTEALVREKVKEQTIINERRKVELDKERGKLLTIKEYDRGLSAQQNAFIDSLEKILPDAACDDINASEKPAMRKTVKTWIHAIRTECARILDAEA